MILAVGTTTKIHDSSSSFIHATRSSKVANRVIEKSDHKCDFETHDYFKKHHDFDVVDAMLDGRATILSVKMLDIILEEYKTWKNQRQHIKWWRHMSNSDFT